MTRKLLRNPAALVLAAAVVVSVFAATWALGFMVDFQGTSWQGEPTEEQLWEQRFFQVAQYIAEPATMLAVSATLGFIIVAAASSRPGPGRYRSTRTMSAAGATTKRAAVTTPNSSPSISTSWGSPSIETSTDRPRE